MLLPRRVVGYDCASINSITGCFACLHCLEIQSTSQTSALLRFLILDREVNEKRDLYLQDGIRYKYLREGTK